VNIKITDCSASIYYTARKTEVYTVIALFHLYKYVQVSSLHM